MTSLSRKKRQTTPPSTPTGTIDREAARGAAPQLGSSLDVTIPLPLSAIPPRQEPLWLPAGLLAVLMTLVTALGATGGEVYDSGWKSTQPARCKAATRLGSTGRAAPVQSDWMRPSIRTAPGKAKIRLVAFDVEMQGPQTRVAQRGAARLRSIVVDSNGEPHGYRVAQDSINDDLIEGFEKPFGAGDQSEEPADGGLEQPELEEPVLEPLPPLGGPTVERDPFDEADDPSVAPSPSDDPDRSGFGGLEDVRPQDLSDPGSRPRTRPPTDDFELAMQNCSEELAELKASRIAEIDLRIIPSGDAGQDYPFECGIDDGTPFEQRNWPQVCYMWKASGLCHKPLYFEDVQLERYGHSWGPCLQPLVSGAHFFCKLPVLPYCMGLKAPNECVYTLGHYRPGSCAPYMISPVPITCRAAAFQAAAWTGGIFAIP